MTVKTTGAEFKRFYSDPEFWPDDTHHDDTLIEIDGVTHENEVDVRLMADDTPVKIVYGWVLSDRLGDDGVSFETYFKRWRKKQNLVSFFVECDASKLEAVKAAIKAAGGRLQS